MSSIDKDGMLIDPKILLKRFIHIEHGNLAAVYALVVHQTDAPTETATFNAYIAGGNGAHFLIARSGLIFQTASLNKRCYHVGQLIKSRCLEIQKKSCSDKDLASAKTLEWTAQINVIDAIERNKNYPARFPVNSDSIGIELVGKQLGGKEWEAVTHLQNMSLKWLVSELFTHFGLSDSDVFRHPEVSYKNPGEAAGAKWK